jgi:uncharacterized damage-inducible protein DinB
VSNTLLDAFRHNSWANRRLIVFCRGLSREQLAASTTGSFGNILETVQHIIGGEYFYAYLLSGRELDWPGFDERVLEPARWEQWTDDLAAFWEAALASPVDPDELLVRPDGEGRIREVRAGVVVAQTLQHGNVHREQVCAIITSLGIEPPDLEVWAYAADVGRDATRPATT